MAKLVLQLVEKLTLPKKEVARQLEMMTEIERGMQLGSTSFPVFFRCNCLLSTARWLLINSIIN